MLKYIQVVPLLLFLCPGLTSAQTKSVEYYHHDPPKNPWIPPPLPFHFAQEDGKSSSNAEYHLIDIDELMKAESKLSTTPPPPRPLPPVTQFYNDNLIRQMIDEELIKMMNWYRTQNPPVIDTGKWTPIQSTQNSQNVPKLRSAESQIVPATQKPFPQGSQPADKNKEERNRDAFVQFNFGKIWNRKKGMCFRFMNKEMCSRTGIHNS